MSPSRRDQPRGRSSGSRPRSGRRRHVPGQFLQGSVVKSRQRQVAEVAAAVALFLLVVGVLAGFRLWRIADRLENARAMLDTVEEAVQQGNLGLAQQRLDEAQAQMLRANGDVRDVHSPELGLVAWLPVVTQNMDALRASVETGLQLVNGGQDILTAARPLADATGRVQVPLSTGAIPGPSSRAWARGCSCSRTWRAPTARGATSSQCRTQPRCAAPAG
jgi:hypothetical protein